MKHEDLRGFRGAYRLLNAAPGGPSRLRDPTKLNSSDGPRLTAPPTPPFGGTMLVFTDLTSTLCTAVVAGFAFGLLLLGNRKR